MDLSLCFPSFLKIFEKVIPNRFTRNVDSNCILVKEQSGFRKGSSTAVASYNLINNILSALHTKLLVGGVFYGLKKAFDCVKHSTLLSKLEFFGITGKANSLMKSCLQDRFQRVSISCNSNIYL
jgi:hypothetical protein